MHDNPWYAVYKHTCVMCKGRQVPRIDISTFNNSVELDPNNGALYGDGVESDTEEEGEDSGGEGGGEGGGDVSVAVGSGGGGIEGSSEGGKKRSLTFEDNDAAQKRQNSATNSTQGARMGSSAAGSNNNTVNGISAHSASGGAEDNPVYESKKYPGKFYRINKATGATEWV